MLELEQQQQNLLYTIYVILRIVMFRFPSNDDRVEVSRDQLGNGDVMCFWAPIRIKQIS